MREVERRYRSGMAHIDIARELGISVPYSSYLGRKAGLGVADGETPRTASARATARDVTVRQVLELYDGGMAHADIVKTLGIGRERSHLICRAAGRSRANGTPPRKRRG